MLSNHAARALAFCLLLSALWLPLTHGAEKPVNDKIKEIAGTAEFLRGVPKHFATLKAVDTSRHQVTLLLDGEGVAKVWPLAPDAEVKVTGWWGRLDQFTLGDRVWVWFKTDRARQPVAVAMLADELSEQDMHGRGIKAAYREGRLTVTPVKGPPRVLRTDKGGFFSPPLPAALLEQFQGGAKGYVQSAGDRARQVFEPAAFEKRRAEQRAVLRQRWVEEGLPGTLAFAHTFSGELDFMLDHEAMRWGRSLRTGDKVTLQAAPPIAAVVKAVAPWRERTQLRLVVNSFEQAELVPGQRLRLKMTPPPAEAENALLPPDLDLPRDRPQRVEWFLASIYCTCNVPGDGCTGHFYTLASCNPNACGMPNHMRKAIAAKIDRGLTDRQIFEELLKEHGADLLRPHLMP